MLSELQVETRAITYVREAERVTLRAGESLEAQPRPVHTVGVVGSGTMGQGITISLLSAGFTVILTDVSPAVLEQGAVGIRRVYESRMARGRIMPEQASQALSLLRLATELDDLRDCDLIIEAVFEEMALKLNVFEQLGHLAKPSAILASNTSFLNIDRLGQASGRPADVVGMHFFSPAHVMKLVEVVRGEHTAIDTLKTALELIGRIGKMPVITGVCYGFIGNQMLMQRPEQAVEIHTGPVLRIILYCYPIKCLGRSVLQNTYTCNCPNTR